MALSRCFIHYFIDSAELFGFCLSPLDDDCRSNFMGGFAVDPGYFLLLHFNAGQSCHESFKKGYYGSKDRSKRVNLLEKTKRFQHQRKV